MKTSLRIIGLFLLAASLLFFSDTVLAASGPRLELAAHPSHVQVGDTLTVEVRVKNAPRVYGADVRLAFDPGILEVVDADASLSGVQFTPGSFIDPGRSFTLRHAVNNPKGTIEYILALLNPAPEAQGNGDLMSITFLAKTSGTALVRVEAGTFGTRSGETFTAELDEMEIVVLTHSALIKENAKKTVSVTVISGAGLVGIGGVVFAYRRRMARG